MRLALRTIRRARPAPRRWVVQEPLDRKSEPERLRPELTLPRELLSRSGRSREPSGLKCRGPALALQAGLRLLRLDPVRSRRERPG